MKLNLEKARGFSSHRSGWDYCINSLRSFHSKAGIFVFDFIERDFSWEMPYYYSSRNTNKIPYRQPWVGFLHNPQNMPGWLDQYHSPQAILARDAFRDSLPKCKAIFVLSDYLGGWLRQQIDVPIFSVKHPTGPAPIWNPSAYLKDKKVIQVGYWLRRTESITKLKTNIPKFWLPSNPNMANYTAQIWRQGTLQTNIEHEFAWKSVKVLEHLPTGQYDELYASSVVFLDLYDSSANNAIVEAIRRNTPILVNKHPAVVEYLGEEYPLYFDKVENARINTEQVLEANRYLSHMDKSWIEGERFALDVVRKLRSL